MFNKKKRFFKQKIESVQNMIWDLEFKVAKSKQIREGIRLDRDQVIQAIQSLNPEKEVEKVKELTERKERYEKQIKMIDDEINGGTPTENSPEGIGINEKLESLHSLKELYKEYIKTI